MEDNIMYNDGTTFYHEGRDTVKQNGDGFRLWGAGTGIIIRNNHSYNNMYYGIRTVSTHTVIVNNTVYGNDMGIQIDDNKNGVIRNNIIYMNNTETDIGIGNTADHNLVGIDPKFVDPVNGDFHLQSDSPAIDAGEPEVSDNIEGNPRLQRKPITLKGFYYYTIHLRGGIYGLKESHMGNL
jgi:parallel beta-helix repeat protein